MEDTARRRPRSAARPLDPFDDTERACRRNATAALQRALDRRDNGGAPQAAPEEGPAAAAA